MSASRTEPTERLLSALDALRTAERAAVPEASIRSGRYQRLGTTLWLPPVPGIQPRRLADPAARLVEPAETELVLTLRSVLVRLGKFSRGNSVKLRGYLGTPEGPVSIKVWSGWGAKAPGSRERRIRAKIAGLPEYRCPETLVDGRVDDIDYLVEPLIYGRHPRAGEERLEAAVDVGTALASAYRRTSRGDKKLSETVHVRFHDRLHAFLHDPELIWDPAWGSRSRLTRSLLRLVERDRLLPVAITHGDLVVTNLIRDDQGGHHLVDWERARVQPVAFDLVKLLLSSGNTATVSSRLAPVLRPFGGLGRKRYRWKEQLALGVAQTMSWSAASRQNAATVGRLERFEAEQRLRLNTLGELLGA